MCGGGVAGAGGGGGVGGGPHKVVRDRESHTPLRCLSLFSYYLTHPPPTLTQNKEPGTFKLSAKTWLLYIFETQKSYGKKIVLDGMHGPL